MAKFRFKFKPNFVFLCLNYALLTKFSKRMNLALFHTPPQLLHLLYAVYTPPDNLVRHLMQIPQLPGIEKCTRGSSFPSWVFFHNNNLFDSFNLSMFCVAGIKIIVYVLRWHLLPLLSILPQINPSTAHDCGTTWYFPPCWFSNLVCTHPFRLYRVLLALPLHSGNCQPLWISDVISIALNGCPAQHAFPVHPSSLPIKVHIIEKENNSVCEVSWILFWWVGRILSVLFTVTQSC